MGFKKEKSRLISEGGIFIAQTNKQWHVCVCMCVCDLSGKLKDDKN